MGLAPGDPGLEPGNFGCVAPSGYRYTVGKIGKYTVYETGNVGRQYTLIQKLYVLLPT